MTLIKLDDDERRYEILANLTENVGRRIGLNLRPYDATAVTDKTSAVHWMYKFNEHENRIYRTQNGSQRMANVELVSSRFIHLDIATEAITTAIKALIVQKY